MSYTIIKTIYIFFFFTEYWYNNVWLYKYKLPLTADITVHYTVFHACTLTYSIVIQLYIAYTHPTQSGNQKSSKHLVLHIVIGKVDNMLQSI